MSGLTIGLGVASCASGALFAFLVAQLVLARASRPKRLASDASESRGAKKQLDEVVVGYCARLSHGLKFRTTVLLSPAVRLGKAETSHAGKFVRAHAARSGVGKSVSVEGFTEARVRLLFAGLAVGALFGCILSNEMAVALGTAGAYFGWSAPSRAFLKRERARGADATSHVSEMLEVVALGLRSGLTFDKSFELYGAHFSSEFAQACASCCNSWTIGVMTRGQALWELAASYDCEELDHAVDGIVRSLRFGSAFADSLEELAAQSRASYRAAVGEKVAKAPVKMMLPTGTLILPAMLLLVLGPVLLELSSGF